MAENLEPVLMENVRIIFRNFSGKEGQYNRAGDRNFAVILSEDQATLMAADDWNIKELKPRDIDEEEHPQAYLPVAVSYKNRPPAVVLISYRDGVMHRTNLNENEVEMLDWVEILNVDLIINPYQWEVNGKGGIKAYLKSMFITINEDPLEIKYSELADAPTS